ncbi:DUF1476 domain-containing protein [Leisingera caerulea]|uniref:DUF1476 domain-containing protein n=1 Tax=Leisingera caerulea TaxID=506591 RepID=A0ABY5WRF8_LEICA|nr:DUF1476 domain-containing protein [Leisingera caerulea]UWQ48268.1 DUF1476 domain-containing protein [Leisingera caerulea]UWQ56901.1 DUF1476 domain-containing protein [Leisingera caerulea]UWQ61178.1 DUF1476 domain-containing protein [Leisingera caerulea]UWQ82040.1 DUF1476 domain-containing protein [Leisingera caerulea]
MTTFDEREQAFEAKFAHDEEMQFKARARRNKLVGLWAAELLGKTGSSANDYAQSIVAADLEEASHEDVVRKLTGDLGSRASEEQIRLKLQELLVQAQAEMLSESN